MHAIMVYVCMFLSSEGGMLCFINLCNYCFGLVTIIVITWACATGSFILLFCIHYLSLHVLFYFSGCILFLLQR